MNAFKNHTNVSTSSMPAPLVICNLISELAASDEIIRTMHRYLPVHQQIHVKLALQDRGTVDQNTQRADERAAVIALAKAFLAHARVLPAASLDLVQRLRTVGGQSVIRPPAIDIEAADHIERLVAQLEACSTPLSRAEADVIAERHRQVNSEGRTPEHDDQYRPGHLTTAGSCYATLGRAWPNAGNPPTSWPFPEAWWKPRDDRANLVRGCALILAEIERLDRFAARQQVAA